MAVPEITIDKDGNAPPWEYEIGLTKKSIVAAPASNTGCAKKPNETLLGCDIAAPLDMGHDL